MVFKTFINLTLFIEDTKNGSLKSGFCQQNHSHNPARVNAATDSIWLETTIALTHFRDRSLIIGQELVHDFDRSLIGVREHLPVHGNMSTNWNLSLLLAFRCLVNDQYS